MRADDYWGGPAAGKGSVHLCGQGKREPLSLGRQGRKEGGPTHPSHSLPRSATALGQPGRPCPSLADHPATALWSQPARCVVATAGQAQARSGSGRVATTRNPSFWRPTARQYTLLRACNDATRAQSISAQLVRLAAVSLPRLTSIPITYFAYIKAS